MINRQLAVNEIYRSFQGEGRYAGQPCTFLRLACCNLTCIWCDTPFTWNWIGSRYAHPDKYDHRKEIHSFLIEEVIMKLQSLSHNHLVITGGEPLLQQNRLIPVLKSLKHDRPWFIEVETNGTIIPCGQFLQYIDHINCSPKLSNSKDPEHLRIKLRVLKFLAGIPHADFKFVIGSAAEIGEVQGLAEKLNIPRDRIWLMPLGKTKDELEKTQYVEQLAQAKGFRFSPRLHIEAYGDKRGV